MIVGTKSALAWEIDTVLVIPDVVLTVRDPDLVEVFLLLDALTDTDPPPFQNS